MTDCVFCKIAAGEIPASVVYEDDKVIAFDDLEPQMPVHTLIIPKQHFANIGDGLPDDLMGHLFNTVKKVAEIKGINKTGYRVIVNTGDRRPAIGSSHPCARFGRRPDELWIACSLKSFDTGELRENSRQSMLVLLH